MSVKSLPHSKLASMCLKTFTVFTAANTIAAPVSRKSQPVSINNDYQLQPNRPNATETQLQVIDFALLFLKRALFLRQL